MLKCSAPDPSYADFPAYAERFSAIIAQLRAVLWRFMPGAGVENLLSMRISNRVGRAVREFQALLARVASGRLRAPPVFGGKPRVRPPAPPLHPIEVLSRSLVMPRGFAWLVRRVPGVGVCGNYLRILLTEPAMAPVLAHPSAGRILRPLLRMLGAAPIPELRGSYRARCGLPPLARKPRVRESRAAVRARVEAAKPPPPVDRGPPPERGAALDNYGPRPGGMRSILPCARYPRGGWEWW